MSTNFPTSLDSFTDPAAGNATNSPSHAANHTAANDAIAACEAAIGITSSSVTTSLTYQMAQTAFLIEKVHTVASSGSTQTIADVTSYTMHVITLTGNCTFTFPTAGAGKSFAIRLVQDGTGSRTATWPATVKWANGSAPTLSTTAAYVDIVSFTCFDGSTWDGFLGGLGFR